MKTRILTGLRTLGAVIALLALATVAQAANGTWNVDANGNWGTTGNWASSVIANGSGYTANFTNNITADRTVNLDSNRTIGSMIFSDNGTNGSAWILSSSGNSTLTMSGGSPTIAVRTPATISLKLANSSGSNIVLTDGGYGQELTLSGSNAFAGSVTLQSGVVNITGDNHGSAGSFYAVPNGAGVQSTLKLQRSDAYCLPTGVFKLDGRTSGSLLRLYDNDNATVKTYPNNLQLGGDIYCYFRNLKFNGTVSLLGNTTLRGCTDAGSCLTLPGVISGSGYKLDVQSPGSSGTVDLHLSGNNTFSGGTSLMRSSLYLGSNTALGTGTLTINQHPVYPFSPCLYSENGARSLSNAMTLNCSVKVDGSSNLTFTGQGTMTDNVTVTVAGGSYLCLAGGMNDPNGKTLTKEDAGELGAKGTFNCDISVNHGSLQSAGTLSVAGSDIGTLTVNGNVNFADDNDGQGTFSVDLNGTSAGTTYDQMVVNGTVTLGNGSYYPHLNAVLKTTSLGLNDTLTIIQNDGTDPIVGRFDAEEGSLVQLNVQCGGGVQYATAKISYVGGTGNDVTLTHFRTSTTQSYLPRRWEYQLDLKNWLATLVTSDFNVMLSNMTYNDNYFANNDMVHAEWLLFDSYGEQVPNHRLLRTPSSAFALSSIDPLDGTIYMPNWDNIERPAATDPRANIWWAGWNYSGNPHKASANATAIKKRALVQVAVDMMEQDEDHFNNVYNRRSDYLGDQLCGWAYTYKKGKDVLDAGTKAAFEAGLKRMFTKIETWGIEGFYADMDARALLGMWYTAEALNDNDLRTRYASFRDNEFIAGEWNSAGYLTHGEAFDAGYQGISFYYLTWLALESNDTTIKNLVAASSKLKAYLTLPENDGAWFFGPSHFNTATDACSANDEWYTYRRDVGTGMITDEAKYLVWTGRARVAAYLHGDLLSVADMKTEINTNTGKLNSYTGGTNDYAFTQAYNGTHTPWHSVYWGTCWMPFAGDDFYPTGYYDSLVALKNSDSPLTKVPAARSADYVENFNNVFLCAKLGPYSVIVHTGNLSNWNDLGLSGFSGGSLSAFWTQAAGPAILGRAAGYQNPNNDTWSDWNKWPVHALSGVASGNKPFSSSRQKNPTSSYTTSSSSATVQVGGALADTYASPNNALVGNVTYSRTFGFTSSGLTVTSSITRDPNQTNTVTELWEMIPVFLGNTTGGPTVSISFWTGSQWVAAGTSETAGVTCVKVQRGSGAIYIHFASAQSIKLSPSVWSADFVLAVSERNLMINLLPGGTGPLPSVSVQYSIDNISPDGGDGTWGVDAGGNWSTASNWVSNVIADGAGHTANFTWNITADRTVNLDTNRTIGSMNFTDNGGNGSAWTLGSSGNYTLTMSGGTPTISVRTPATISLKLANAFGDNIVTTDGGYGQELTLSGNNAFAGSVTLKSGVLNLTGDNSSSMGSILAVPYASGVQAALKLKSANCLPTGIFTVDGRISGSLARLYDDDNATKKTYANELHLGGPISCYFRNLQFNGKVSLMGDTTLSGYTDVGSCLTLPGNISGSAYKLDVQSPNSSGTLDLHLSGDNAFSGGTSLMRSSLYFGSDTALGTGTLTINQHPYYPWSPHLYSENGTRSLSNAITFNCGIQVGSSSDLTFTGQGTLNDNATMTVDGGSYLCLAGGMNDPNTKTLTKAGSGELGAAGTYNPDIVIGAGTLSVAGKNIGALTVNGNISFTDSNSTFAVDLNGTNAGTTYDQMAVNGTVTLGSGGYYPTLKAVLKTASLGSGDTLAIIVNDGTDAVSGHFNGLTEGSTVTLVVDVAGVTSATASISYVGGTGNDVTLYNFDIH